MASVARSLSISGMQSGTICPPHIPKQQKGLGRFCVKISTDIIDANGMRRLQTQAREKHRRVDETATEPLITTIEICDVCDGRIEVHNVRENIFYHLLSNDPCNPI